MGSRRQRKPSYQVHESIYTFDPHKINFIRARAGLSCVRGHTDFVPIHHFDQRDDGRNLNSIGPMVGQG